MCLVLYIERDISNRLWDNLEDAVIKFAQAHPSSKPGLVAPPLHFFDKTTLSHSLCLSFSFIQPAFFKATHNTKDLSA
uniref:Uncharacterized protein n=1 Tax=Amphimedon queenslandica TaxID=400682 RepID=A0A1X7UXS6_AMPQE